LQTVSHDIRGPVGMLGLSIDLLWQTFEKLSEDELSHRLSVLSRESGRLVDLCNTFLDLEKFDSDSVTLNIQKVDLVLLCERARESVEILTNSRDQDIEIQNRDSVELYCDADRLMQVLVNLLSNAIKFSPVNSTISINIEIDAVSNDTVISVRDEGSGFSSEDASRLFEKFSQLNNAKGRAGSGLGLWICKQLVELHGATISCSSAPGEGTTFTIRFPRVQSEARI
ncbi:MAG: HAMP domain-containing histidine kinase, partial [Cyanobacteria bacterium]|nr:HAMP domain-containing histidine kinase [Cyanobacteriota bacterium]